MSMTLHVMHLLWLRASVWSFEGLGRKRLGSELIWCSSGNGSD